MPGLKPQKLSLKRIIELIDTIEKCPVGKKKKKSPRNPNDKIPNTRPVNNSTTNNQIRQLQIVSGQLGSPLHRFLKFVAFQREPFSTLLDKENF